MPKADKKRRRQQGAGPSSSSHHRGGGTARTQQKQQQHDPLGQQIARDDEATRYAASNKATTTKGRGNDDDEIDEDYDHDTDKNSSNSNDVLDRKSSRRILDMSREQRLEEEERHMIEGRRRKQQMHWQRRSLEGHRRGRNRDDDDDNDNESGSDRDDDPNSDDEDNDGAWVHHDDQGYVSVVLDPNHGDGIYGEADVAAAAATMSKEDLDLVHSMMHPAAERRTLADLILEKIDERQKEVQQQQQQPTNNKNNSVDDPSEQLPPKVVHVYTEIGKMLSRYTAGKLPKAFKVIPSLSNWQDVLWLTRPDLWTPQAMYAATRIFASNLNPKMAQQFYQLVLLDAVRNDIHYNKKLNYHYYVALKKSIYKPAAFFKGILLPLVEPDADTTLREAIIVASVLQRVSIPVHHAAVAIHKLAQTATTTTTTTISSSSRGAVTYNGPVSIFLKVLLNKKYSLPAPVIDGVVSYFTSFLAETRVPGGHDNVLPVLWHQALLVFVQRYKDEIRTSVPAMKHLRLVMKRHYHPKLTPEIRRELLGGQQAYKEQQNQDREQQPAEEEGMTTMDVE